MSTRETTKAELESMLDGGHSPRDIVAMLAEVCEEKAEWVMSPESVGEPDPNAARVWNANAKKLGACQAALAIGHSSYLP